jgi:transcriptional regulator with XRE-family HTH domain
MPHTKSKTALWATLLSLMEKHYGSENQNRLSRDAGVGVATINRVKSGQTSIGLDVVEKLAAAFGLEAWQLICPGFDVSEEAKPPSPMATDLARAFDQIKDPATQQKAYAIAHQVLTFGLPPAPPKAPEAAPVTAPVTAPASPRHATAPSK